MRLLFISRFIPYTGGREVILQSLLHFLSKQYDIHLLTPDTGYHPNDFEIHNFVGKRELQELIRKIKPQLINVHTFYFAINALRIAKKIKVPIALTLHGLFLEEYGNYYRETIRKITNQVDIVSVVCEFHKNELIKLGLNDCKIILIRNGINLDKFTLARPDRYKVRQILNLPLHEKIIVTPSRLTPIKGLDTLVKALSMVKSGPRLLITVPVGRYNTEERQYGQHLVKMARRLCVVDRLIIQFHESDIMPFVYRAANLFVLPSVIEGTPLSLLEAMASRLPCVASSVGGISEIINDGKNGYLFMPNDAAQLALLIDKGLRSDKIDRITNSAFITVRSRFNQQQMFNGYSALFNQLIYRN